MKKPKPVNIHSNRMPSVDRLVQELRIDRDAAIEIRKIWKHMEIDDVLDNYPNTRDWYISCYHKPRNREIRKNAIAERLWSEGFSGVGTVGRNRVGLWVDVLNAGDSYTPTLSFAAGSVVITTLAGLLESGYVREVQSNDDYLPGA